MTPAGWIIMLASNAAVIGATAWCFYRILMLPPVEAETLHGQPAIDTKDTADPD
jgi:hypothetical protein